MPERIFTILATGPFPAAENRSDIVPPTVSLEIIPFIRLSVLSDQALASRLSALSRLSINAIFTSSEAVRAVRALIPVPENWSAWCTSGPTALSVREWLGNEALAGSSTDAAELADRIVKAGLKEVVFFSGNHRRDVLPDRLKEENIACDEITVYESVASPVRLQKNYDAVLFFSPGAVTSFLSLNSIAPQTAVFALGKTTADALYQRITGTVTISQQPDKIMLLQKAVEYAHAHPII